MDVFKLFIAKDCLLCRNMKEILVGKSYTTYDISTVDGLTEALYYRIVSTPTILMVDSEGEEVARLTGNDIIKEKV